MKPTLAHRLLAALVLSILATAAFAQSPPPADPSAQTNGDRLLVRIGELEAGLAAHEDEIAMLEDRLEVSEGLARTLFVTRLDEARLALFDTTIRLAREVIDARERGIDVEPYIADVTEILRSLPDNAMAAADRIRERMSLETEPETPGDAILADQQLAFDAEEVDQIHSALADWLEVAPEFGIETAAERERLAELLADSAANRSVYLEVATREVVKLRSAVATLANDEELQSWLSAMEARQTVASQALQEAVALMNRLDMENQHYRQQLLATTGEITTDVLDVGFMANLVQEWTATATDIISSEGPGFIFSIFLAVILLMAFMQLGKILQRIVAGILRNQRVRLSSLLQKMVQSTVRNIVIIIGALVALSQLGISLGPLLAGLGIAGFIIGFALQDSLSNFASGMMILIYRPFDVGDFVEVAGVTGTVDSMSLVNTTFLTIDHKKLVVPNNTVWQSVITNYTDQKTRRVDLVFGISYGDDIDKAESIIHEVLTGYDTILDEPEPVVKVGELGESSVNLLVRPWVRTEDYWTTYWDLTKLIKQAFDRNGITIPFPQRDLHVIYPESGAGDARGGQRRLQEEA